MTKNKKKSYDVYGTTGVVLNNNKARVGIVLKSGSQFKEIQMEFVLTNTPEETLLELCDTKTNTMLFGWSI